MKKTLAILTVLVAVIDTVFDLNILGQIGMSENIQGYIKLGGIILSTLMAYLSNGNDNESNLMRKSSAESDALDIKQPKGAGG